jgi:uncharacterized YccA/Bax inhibitor family protein
VTGGAAGATPSDRGAPGGRGGATLDLSTGAPAGAHTLWEGSVRSSNPVLTRLTPETAGPPAGASPYGSETYPGVVTAPAVADRMTVDDVVVRTAGLLAIVGISGALAWTMVPDRLLLPVWIGAAMGGLILGLVIAFARIANPAVIVPYAIVEGVFVGIVSKFFENQFEGIVLQAALGTFGLFFVMALLYKARVIRATPLFVKIVMSALIGVVGLIVLNLVLSLFGINTHLRDGSGLAIVFSLVVIVIASLTFVLDFAQIEEGVRQGLPKKYAWLSAFGILVGLIWLYLEILRLLSYLRDD